MTAAAYRRSMWAGILFVVLFVLGALMSMDSPSFNSSDTATSEAQKWATYFAKSSHRTMHIVGAYLLIVGAIAFIWFCLGLRARLELAGVRETIPGRFVTALSVVAAGGMVASAMFTADIAGAVTFGQHEKAPVSGDAARWITDLTVPFLIVVFALASGAIIGAIVLATTRSAAFPRWVGYTGWLAGLGSITAVAFIPILLPLIWYLAVAVNGLARPAAFPAAPVAATA
jgi:hypothetical protein